MVEFIFRTHPLFEKVFEFVDNSNVKCKNCNKTYKCTRKSNLDDHLSSKNHRANSEKDTIDQDICDNSLVGHAIGKNVSERPSQPSTRSHTIDQFDMRTNKQQTLTQEFQFDLPQGVASKPPSKDPSLKTKSSELGGALNADQFNMNTYKENNELQKEVHMLRQHINKLEDKLAEQDVVQLTIELAQVKVRLEERDRQMAETRADLKQRETEWLEQFKQIYNMSKQPHFHEELKRKLESMTVSHNSKQVSPHESPIYSQNEQSQDEIMEEVVEIFGFQNIGFTCYAGAALQCVQAI